MVEMRYEGQEHSVRVPVPSDKELHKEGLGLLQAAFDRLHEQAYAHASPGTPTEIVNLRLWSIQETKKPGIVEISKGQGNASNAVKGHRDVYFKKHEGMVSCPIYDREKFGAGDKFAGPGVVEEWDSTIVVLPGQSLEVDQYGNLIIYAK
jgi:N-methylhydantoinase A